MALQFAHDDVVRAPGTGEGCTDHRQADGTASERDALVGEVVSPPPGRGALPTGRRVLRERTEEVEQRARRGRHGGDDDDRLDVAIELLGQGGGIVARLEP